MSVNFENIVQRTLVPHSAYSVAHASIEQSLRHTLSGGSPVCLAIVGESRTGKTRVMEEILVKHQRRVEDGITIVPVLSVTTPSKPTVKGLAEVMLTALGDPLAEKGTETTKSIRLQKLLRQSQTKMLFIDEFQHFYDKTSDQVWHHVADWLKTLVDKGNFALVVAGLPDCLTVIQHNEQLAGRFKAPLYMERFSWESPVERAHFRGILNAFQTTLSKHFTVPDLGSNDMAFRFYCATGGLMGYVTNILRQLVWNAIDQQSTSLTLENLEEAYLAVFGASIQDNGPRVANPFKRDFLAIPTVEQVSKAKKIGVRTLEVKTRHRRS